MQNALTRQQWADKITSRWQDTVQSIFDVGRYLIEAMEQLGSEYTAMVESDLPFNLSTARKLRLVASDSRLTDRSHVNALPASWGTLYELSTLSDGQLAAIDMRPDIERKEITAIKKEARRTQRLAEITKIARGNAALSMPHQYPVLYADPPWRYENPPMGDSGRSIENHYPTMTLEEICDLPVADVATEDAILYLWSTSPKLAECMQVVEAWGFEYRTSFVWVKDKIGMGYHARNQHELLLVCRRGNMPAPPFEARVSSVVHAPRTEHSAKPARFYEIIENNYPRIPKLELFARKARSGWDRWGNQADAA